MNDRTLSRRTLLKSGSAAVATLAILNNHVASTAAPLKQGEEVLRWVEQSEENKWAQDEW